MAAGVDSGLDNWRELSSILGGISQDDYRLLVEELGKPGSSSADLAQIVYEELESSRFTSVPDLVSSLKQNGFSNGRNGYPHEKNGLTWSLAKSRSSTVTNKYAGGSQSGSHQRSAAATSHSVAPGVSIAAMPYSGTNNPIQIQRTPKGYDYLQLRSFLSKYLHDPEMRGTLYEVLEKQKQSSKLLILMRGASGTGKSTLASIIWGICSQGGEICSADHYFINRSGQYNFNRDLLKPAHKACKARCSSALARGDSPVIIDNTNTTVEEMFPYAELAVKYGYEIKIVEPKTEWGRKPGKLAQKNVHNVPRKTIESQLDRFEKTTAEELIAMGRKMQGGNPPKQELDWGTALPPSLPMGHWQLPPKTVDPIMYNYGPVAAAVKTPLSSPSKLAQSSWKEPPPVSPSSPMRLSDYVPDLKSANGKGHKSKKSGKKNGNGSSSPTTPPPLAGPARAPFEDPAHAAFGRLENYFPTVPKEELMHVFNKNDGDLDACAVELIEQNFEMSDNICDTKKSGIEGAFDLGQKSEDTPWDVVDSDSAAGTSSGSTEVCSSGKAVSSTDVDDDDMLYAFEGEVETAEEEPEIVNLVLPVPFARLLLRHYGHPDDEHRELSMDELTVKIGADVAFEIYKGLYINMHNTDSGMGSSVPSTSDESSTRSSSPSSSSVEDEFDAIAISLGQMDLETSSGNPQLSAIIDIESKLHHQRQESLREYSAPYRTMAQHVSFSMLKQDYPYLDAAIIDEVYSQCMLDVGKTKAALNEMYPHLSPVEQSNQNSSSTDSAWKLKYNPKDVQMYCSTELQSMQRTYEEKEKDWSSKMTKFRDYHDKCKTMSNPQIKAHYIMEAKKLSDEMKELADEIQYYRAVRLNAKHNNDNVLDLHGLKVTGAIRVLKEFLQYKEYEFVASQAPKMILLIITGQGKHSKNGMPVLQPAVRNFLSQKTYRYHTGKPGTYTVILSRGSVSRQKIKS